MKGIILKDLYENFRIFKNGVSYLAAVLFLFLLIEAMQTGDLFSLKYFFMLITAFVFPLLGCHTLIPRTGINDHRKGTAAHSCIRTGRCFRHSAPLYIFSELF